MIAALRAGVRLVALRLVGLGLRSRLCRLRSRLSGLHEVGDRGLDRFIRGQLSLWVELELAAVPGEGADNRIVARDPVALGVEQMPEEEVQRSRLSRAIPHR